MTATSTTDYLVHLEVERRMSAHTLDAYRRDLAALSEWAQAQGIIDLETLQPGQLRAFVAAEHRRGLSPKILQRRLSACRSWFQVPLKHGRITPNPTAALTAPRATPTPPPVPHASDRKNAAEGKGEGV